MEAGSAGRLSIEIVAELARLTTDLDKAKRMVKAASADISASARTADNSLSQIGKGASSAAGGINTAAAAASEAAASLLRLNNAAARNAGQLAGVGDEVQITSNELVNLGFQFQDLAVQIASGGNPFVALIQQGSQVSGIISQSGLGFRVFAKELAEATGIIRVSGNASLQAAAAAAAANQAAIGSALQRAEADVIAARAEEALARAAIANATTAAESAAAQVALAQATNSAATASARAAAASTALAEANAASAAASSASAASQVTTLGRLGVVGLGAAAALGAVAAATAILTKEVNDNADVQVSWQNVLLGAYDVIKDEISNSVTGAFQAMGIDVGAVWDAVVKYTKMAVNIMIGVVTLVPRLIITAFKVLPAGLADVFFSAVNLSIRAINGLVEKSVAAINGFLSLVNPLLEKVGLSVPKLLAPRIAEVQNSYAGAAQAAAGAFVSTFTDTFTTDFAGGIADAIGGAAVKRQLAENAEKSGKDAGKAGGRAMGEAAAEEYPKAFLEALARQGDLVSSNMDKLIKSYGDAAKATDELRTKQADLRDEYRSLLDELQIERNLIGATAQEREIAALYLEREGFMARYAALGIQEATRMWEEYLAARKGIIDGEAAFEAEIRRVERLSGALEGLAGLIGGGAGRGLSQILSIELELKDGTVERLADTLSRVLNKTLDKISDGLGDKFGKVLQAAGQGAQIGDGVDSIFKAIGIKSSNTGAQLGGAIGGAFFGPLGAIGGSILGGLVGGMLKGTKRASVTVSGIGGAAMQTAIQGNSGKLKEAATGLANGLIGGLTSIAQQFGGQIGNFGGISVGTRNGTFRVDPTGQGKTKNLPQFATEEEAIREALRIAISRGAITGIREGTNALLRGAGDLEAQINKALAFEGVFQRLAQATDPLGFALGNLEKEFTALRAIFAEAGATTAELAQLEQLYGIERTKVMEQFKAEVDETGQVIGAANDLLRERRALEARLLELQGDAAGALAIQRELELAAMDATLRPLMQQIYALEDQQVALDAAARAADEAAQAAARLAEEEQRLTEQRQGLEVDLLRALGKETEAVALQRQLELAALDESLRGLKSQIFAAQDAAAAADAAAQAEQERNRVLAEAAQLAEQAASAERELSRQRRSLEADILELTGNSIGAVALRRQLELEQMDASLRPLQERVFALQDEQAAAQAAAEAQAEAARIAEQAAADAIRAAQDAAQEIARIAGERSGLEIRLLEATGDAAGALAASRALELAGIDESNRAILAQIFAAEDAARAAQALADAQAEAARAQEDAAREAIRIAEEAAQQAERIANERIGLEGRLLEAQGQTAEIRRRELEALEPSNRVLLERLFQIEDETARIEARNRAQEEAAAAAARRNSLEIRYLEAIGDSAGALAMRRAEELAATDASDRALLQMIFAAEDAAAAVGGVTDSFDALREAAGLQIRLLEAQGREEEALALRRQQEMAATAEVNRALLGQVFAAEDAARARAEADRLAEEAARAAADAQAELARAQQEAARAAEEAARILAEIARERTDLTIRLYELEGRNAEALAMRRQLELDATDVSNRALLQQIFALEDAAIAQAEYAEALERQTALIEEARNNLSGAYEREADALRNTADQFREFGASLREFRAGLFAADAGTQASYRQLQVDFLRTSALASTGDATALGQLQGSGSAFLEASRAQASTQAQYLRDVAFVARAVDDAIAASDEAVNYAEEQLTALQELVSGYIELNENVLTVAQAIRDLEAALTGETVALPNAPVGSVGQQMAEQSEAIATSNADLRTEITALRADLNAALLTVARNTRESADVLKRADGGDFLRVGSDPDTPVYTSAAP